VRAIIISLNPLNLDQPPFPDLFLISRATRGQDSFWLSLCALLQQNAPVICSDHEKCTKSVPNLLFSGRHNDAVAMVPLNILNLTSFGLGCGAHVAWSA
jgi:hypothetical protein